MKSISPFAASGTRAGATLMAAGRTRRTLEPDERLAFVPHDMFAVPFAEIVPSFTRSPDAVKMLALSRAAQVAGRAHVEPGPTGAAGGRRRLHRHGARRGPRSGGSRCSTRIPHGTTRYPHGRVMRLVRTEVNAAADHGLRAAVTVRRVLVNGEPGVLA